MTDTSKLSPFSPPADHRALVGGAAPLFDRLVDEDLSVGSEMRPRAGLSRAGLVLSIERDVNRLLNTRCPLPADSVDGTARSVIDYGMPDFAHVGTSSGAERAALARWMTTTITAFEPRLRDVSVVVEHYAPSERRWAAVIRGRMVVGELNEPLSFPVTVAAFG